MNRLQCALFMFCYLCLRESVFVCASNEDSDNCNTPDQKLGQCMLVKKCAPLADLMLQKPLSAEITNFLKKSQCGFEGFQPKICCPLDSKNEIVSMPWSWSVNENDNILPDTNTCGLHPYSIQRGHPHASVKEFPWLVLLQYEKPHGYEFNCGGSLINKRYVLTSAHCVARVPESWKLVKVRLGENNLNTSIDCDHVANQSETKECADAPIDIRVAETIIHEQYDPEDLTQQNDIALLRLNKDVIFTDFVRPICLPKPSEHLSGGNSDGKMTVAGWGLLSETRSHSNVKLKSMVPLKPYAECTSTYEAIHVDLHGQLCTEEHDSCTVDSGGPLMVHNSTSTGFNWYIAGVKSFGPTPCGNNNWPDVYTKVVNYVEWIISHVKP